MNPCITSIGTANPDHCFGQKEIANFMKAAQQLDEHAAEQLNILYRATGIQQRYSVIPDYGNSPDEFKFYPDNQSLSPFPSTKDRALLYQKEAPKLALTAVEDCLGIENNYQDITHLITVSCTGMYAPGLDIDLQKSLKMSPSIQRTCINFMGCYAGFNALKMAYAQCKTYQEARILIVCVELCSLHFQKEINDDFMLANALFSDGAAAILVENNIDGKTGLSLEAFHCNILQSAEEEMSWNIGNFGFEMKLSDKVPSILGKGVVSLVNDLRRQSGLGQLKIDKYAVHPGGKKILKVIEEALNISKEDNEFAREVLKLYGNMSSVTIFFVLQRIWDSMSAEDNDKHILALAFGPGLTLESMVLKILN
jgi:predicted naringenin-chalcone synthase